MAASVNKFENIFNSHKTNLNEADLQEYVLGKIFPTIRYGRDTDLERYVNLRENGHGSADWHGFFNSLTLKYTEDERKLLIRCMRKNLDYFQYIFSRIITDVYKRIIKMLKRRIDLLVKELAGVESISKAVLSRDHNMLRRVETIIGLCAQNKSDALDGINFLTDLGRNLGYKQKQLGRIQSLVKRYFDGSLFEEAELATQYHFDIKEEYKKQKKLPAGNDSGEIKLKIFITEEDIGRILINNQKLNEYELSFSYFEKYIKFVNDPEFATKIYVYSKKHNTAHYQIFESIRKGALYNYQKNRVFDDIFKVICQGRYVFNITNERQMDRKLKSIGRPAKPPAQAQNLRAEIPENRPDKEESGATPSPTALPQAAAEKAARAAASQAAAPKAAAEKAARAAADKAAAPKAARVAAEKSAPAESIPRETVSGREGTQTIQAMTETLHENKKIHRMLVHEFRDRLGAELTEHLGFHNNRALSNENKVKQLKELIHYVIHNYDSIIGQEQLFSAHKERIESLGFSLHEVYTVILNCFNGVKSDFLTGRMNDKINRSLSGRFKFF